MEKKIIFGAPGCGKTTYLLNVLKKELKTHNPERIAFISFTKKGAQEGLARSREKFDYPAKSFKYFRTLHSLCFELVGAKKDYMLGKKDYKILSDALHMKFIGYYTEEFYHNDDKYLFLYFLKLNNYEMYKKMSDSFDVDIRKLKFVAHNYDRYKEYSSKVDFTDLLTMTLERKYVLKDVDIAIIDEAQDLTTLQWKVIEQIFSNVERMYIAGDDDQAIYEWSGADINYFLGIEGERIILDKSWRLRENILKRAKLITKEISVRVDKDFKPLQKGGVVREYNTIRDFDFQDNETYYCLARNNYFLKRYIKELKRQAKVFMFKGKLSYDIDIVFAINNFDDYVNDRLSISDKLRVDKNIKENVSNLANRKWYEALNLDNDDIFYYRKLIENKVELTGNPNITVSTIHGVKGGEADNVLLLMDVTRAVYKQIYNFSDSEMRVLYVAFTRARYTVSLIHAETKRSYTDFIRGII